MNKKIIVLLLILSIFSINVSAEAVVSDDRTDNIFSYIRHSAQSLGMCCQSGSDVYVYVVVIRRCVTQSDSGAFVGYDFESASGCYAENLYTRASTESPKGLPVFHRAGTTDYEVDQYGYTRRCTVYCAPLISQPPPTPKPVIVPPALSRFFDLIWVGLKGMFGLSIAGGQTISTVIHQPYSTPISLSFVAPDVNYTDGSYQAKFGEWFITDSNKNILKESGWSSELTASPWVGTATFTPTTAAKYYLIGVVVSQQYTWNGAAWTVSETVETKEVQEIVAALPAVTKAPVTTSSSGILANLSAWLKSIFSWLPW
jgi:hypothetical protein